MTLDDVKLILVPTDLSEASTAALRAAIRLAQVFHASIEVFHGGCPVLVVPAGAPT